MPQVFSADDDRPRSSHRYDYCAGCGHGTSIRLVVRGDRRARVAPSRTVGVLGSGLLQSNPVTFDFDCQLALHGRAPAMATAVKRLFPDRLVFAMQGDGDLAAIGTTEIVHAAHPGRALRRACS